MLLCTLHFATFYKVFAFHRIDECMEKEHALNARAMMMSLRLLFTPDHWIYEPATRRQGRRAFAMHATKRDFWYSFMYSRCSTTHFAFLDIHALLMMHLWQLFHSSYYFDYRRIIEVPVDAASTCLTFHCWRISINVSLNYLLHAWCKSFSFKSIEEAYISFTITLRQFPWL